MAFLEEGFGTGCTAVVSGFGTGANARGTNCAANGRMGAFKASRAVCHLAIVGCGKMFFSAGAALRGLLHPYWWCP